MGRLEEIRRRTGDWDPEQESFHRRCHRHVQRMKGRARRGRSEAEGIDDVVTYSVLAAEGFLPGYGLDTGSILGMAEVPRGIRGLRDFDLPRPPSMALREYVPGNLIYSNGQRFVPRRYVRGVGEEQEAPIALEVSFQRQAVKEAGGTAAGDPSSAVVTSIPICDVTLVHQSQIMDEEDYRFQPSVSVFGRELDQHEGGQAYRWGDRNVYLCKNTRLQLVNVGATSAIRSQGRFGYPVCLACGQSVSPFASQRQVDDFESKHEEWCGQRPKRVAFRADLSVDTLTIPGCRNREEAYSLAEGLRFAAAEVLDMHLDDLHVLVIGRPDADEVDALLYDPMPGGSGLLEQLCSRFDEVSARLAQLAGDCPSQCESSCIDCFRIYRNAFYHEYLNRHVMREKLDEYGATWEATHKIPPRQPAPPDHGSSIPVNVAERKLRTMLRAAGFPDGNWQERYPLPRPLNSTTPDLTYRDPDDEMRRIFIYLDGLSKHIHGNPETEKRDREIRSELRAKDHCVIEITAHDLDDANAMIRHFKKLARELEGRDAVERVSQQAGEWFAAREETEETGVLPFRLVEPSDEDKFKTCVPLYDLKAAAGGFSGGQTPEPEGWAAIETGRALTPNMFVAQVVGKSMEPRIPDGSYCLFTRHVGGSRHGRILLVQHREISDPETGGSYTVKTYHRPPQDREEGAGLEGTILLRPLNPAYEPIVLQNDLEDLAVVAEFLDVAKTTRS